MESALAGFTRQRLLRCAQCAQPTSPTVPKINRKKDLKQVDRFEQVTYIYLMTTTTKLMAALEMDGSDFAADLAKGLKKAAKRGPKSAARAEREARCAAAAWGIAL